MQKQAGGVVSEAAHVGRRCRRLILATRLVHIQIRRPARIAAGSVLKPAGRVGEGWVGSRSRLRGRGSQMLAAE